jgi:hypothetical protein
LGRPDSRWWYIFDHPTRITVITRTAVGSSGISTTTLRREFRKKAGSV